MGNFWSYLSVTVLMIIGVLMIFIILLQRGRGGGLAGAFGGAGGQSALGTKAGDVFTRITIGLAVIWVFLSCISIYALRAGSEGRLTLPGAAAGEAPKPGLAGKEEDENADGGVAAPTDSKATTNGDAKDLSPDAGDNTSGTVPPAGDNTSSDGAP